MQVLLLTQYYAPEPCDKWLDLASKLEAAGHDVEVLTGFPCYPFGRLYEGYRQSLCHVEWIDGRRVIRCPQFPDHSRSPLRRILYYCSFALSAALIGIFRTRRPDVILVYQSAAPIGFTAWLLSRVKRAPYVLDVADLWPESVTASGMLRSRAGEAIIRRFMKFVYDGAAEINVITKGYRQSLVEMGVAEGKINLVYYWHSDARAVGPQKAEAADRVAAEQFTVCYAGAMGPCQGLQVVLDAAEGLFDLPGIRFQLIGDGVERASLEEQAAKRGLGNVQFLGHMTPTEADAYLRRADLLLVHLKPGQLASVSIPSKTFACMSAGRPLLMAVAGEATELVEAYRCGETAAPSDPASLQQAILRHRSRSKADRVAMGKNARQAYQSMFSSKAQAPKLIASLARASRRRTCAPRSIRQWSANAYRRGGKRAFDLMAAVILMVLTSPVMLLAAMIVKWRLGSPVLFTQERPGKSGRVFRIAKFRTMTDRRDQDGRLLKDADRITPLGRFLRSTSLDELPELWNVLRGDMSLVGPRPLLPEYLVRYTAEEARRHEVRPGVTGLAQVNGRNAISWEEKLRYDVQYVDSVTLAGDLAILWRTLSAVVRRSGVTAKDHATMPIFHGTQNQEGHVEQAA